MGWSPTINPLPIIVKGEKRKMKTILRAEYGEGGKKFLVSTNGPTQAIMESCSSLLKKVTGIDQISTTVLMRRAMYALTMELAAVTQKLGETKTEDIVEALAEERAKQKALLVRLAGRDVTVQK
jgi:hypothetical protein